MTIVTLFAVMGLACFNPNLPSPATCLPVLTLPVSSEAECEATIKRFQADEYGADDMINIWVCGKKTVKYEDA